MQNDGQDDSEWILFLISSSDGNFILFLMAMFADSLDIHTPMSQCLSAPGCLSKKSPITAV